MVRIKDMPLTLKLFMKAYPWRNVGKITSTQLTKSLSECTVAIVSSAGMITPGDEPFDGKVKGGDWTWRTIPSDTDVQTLEEHHNSDSFDHTGIAADGNMGIPLDRLNELAHEGVIGAGAPRHFSLMGSITAPGRLQRRTAPEIAEQLADDNVDVALMVPV
ncbi:MAG: hypothetical protein GY906_32920 [bacterium]|nr:hypothetical protein [bacterium]